MLDGARRESRNLKLPISSLKPAVSAWLFGMPPCHIPFFFLLSVASPYCFALQCSNNFDEAEDTYVFFFFSNSEKDGRTCQAICIHESRSFDGKYKSQRWPLP